jgi:RNA polymerase sigma factor (sigma-70 family)
MPAKPCAKSSQADFIPTRRTLLSRLRDLDDHASWRDFFDTYWKLIYSTALKSGLPAADAEDVVQETLLTVARSLPEFRYDPALGSFKGWLLHTTRWRILDHLRKHGPETPVASAGADVPETIEQIAGPENAQIEAAWEAEWQQNLMDAAVQRVKRQVNPKHYQIFELYALKEWSAGKVARTLGVNVAQVHLIKHRVGNLIRKEVKRLAAQGI